VIVRTTAGEPIDLAAYEAMLFDLDGVITRTAAVHSAAWKVLFDEFLEGRARERGEPFDPFEIATDYVRYVDGRRRYDGVATFLASRGIELPRGDSSDPPETVTVCGLGNRKDRYFNQRLDEQGIEIFDDAVAVVRRAHDLGQGVAVVSASENAAPVLERAGILDLFPVRMTGVEASALRLPGKPAPDTFVEAARQLGVAPAQAIVFEDAISGVEAGAAGGFGLVVGVDRVGGTTPLTDHGAHVMLDDLTALLE